MEILKTTTQKVYIFPFSLFPADPHPNNQLQVITQVAGEYRPASTHCQYITIVGLKAIVASVSHKNTFQQEK